MAASVVGLEALQGCKEAQPQPPGVSSGGCTAPDSPKAWGRGSCPLSRVLCLPDVAGGHIALLAVGLGQPPLSIACDVLKLQDPESLVS